VRVYRWAVVTAYPERPLDEPQEPAMVRDFLIRGLTIPTTLLLSVVVSFFSGSAAIWTRFVMLVVDEFVVRERLSQVINTHGVNLR
jgi:hypothetical protein